MQTVMFFNEMDPVNQLSQQLRNVYIEVDELEAPLAKRTRISPPDEDDDEKVPHPWGGLLPPGQRNNILIVPWMK